MGFASVGGVELEAPGGAASTGGPGFGAVSGGALLGGGEDGDPGFGEQVLLGRPQKSLGGDAAPRATERS